MSADQTQNVVERNRAQQIEWYGEPLGDRLGRLRDRLELSQSALAEVLGLSAPMLSQLMSGNRAKISNPAVLARLLSVEALASDTSFERMSSKQLRERLDQIRQDTSSSASTTRLPTAAEPRPDVAGTVGVIQALLREVASAADIESAAGRLDADFPDLAAFLRLYGNGKSADARAHLARTIGPTA